MLVKDATTGLLVPETDEGERERRQAARIAADERRRRADIGDRVWARMGAAAAVTAVEAPQAPLPEAPPLPLTPAAVGELALGSLPQPA